MQYQLIEDFISLQTLCQQYSKASVLAIDTEFVRTRTFYPKLGLLQVYDGKTLALIDPIAIDDLSPFWQLLTNENIVKVLHACSEDLEVFLTSANCKPVNLLDSQIMMSFLGHGLSIGYAAMVEHFTGIELDKSESRTDWTRRPLSAKQLDYASADVEHLFNIYPKLVTLLEQVDRFHYAQQETQLLIERKFTPVDENLLYRQMKLAWRLNAKQLNILQHLAKWRYQQAKIRDLPLGYVVKENTLMAVAANIPASLSAMSKLDGAEVLDIRHKGKAMLAIVQEANKDKEASYPKKIQRLDEYPGYKQIFKQVKSFIKAIGDKHDLTVENLASKKQINQFLTWYFDLNEAKKYSENTGVYPDILIVWRKELFGELLQDFAEKGFK
ncbi:ribonuclease D [Colwellia sp. 4_MG-2023]|jgi:ribonuclease D|uniref:ribonuclease D n=1 Tax=unclassified Colwellia TaxID=196834 RepID=UPI001C0857B6|nr:MULTISPECIES: ribonuclease D [unclassified Colwellia]MBU2923997.1 ribonuclease D [Colwellia sp. C2M11]MDO6488723.1 ribonuclease D [Colwellia sp. 6_MG-2023]MDO6507901.1 ribonuclease D [Colwellia sp. 5_MG-2023]MDO6556546.1 ribonuclease D [Colwellia sp. 4_MG-2023]MDO6653634.1 ribonuclease D [Colwellia sp. 3_MG-2023]